jgi:arginase
MGLIWFDAHGDMNTPETTPSGNIHGMALAIALGLGDPDLTGIGGFKPKVDPRRRSSSGRARSTTPRRS